MQFFLYTRAQIDTPAGLEAHYARNNTIRENPPLYCTLQQSTLNKNKTQYIFVWYRVQVLVNRSRLYDVRVTYSRVKSIVLDRGEIHLYTVHLLHNRHASTPKQRQQPTPNKNKTRYILFGIGSKYVWSSHIAEYGSTG